jgi:hypothetical protein
MTWRAETMQTPISLSSVVNVSPDQVSADMSSDASGDVVVLQLKDGVYYQLDRVGARIWALIQAPTKVSVVLDTLLAEYDVAMARCEADLIALLERLAAANLILVTDGTHK